MLAPPLDPREPVARLSRDLDSRPSGLSGREAVRRLTRYGPNALTVGHHRTWPRALVRQFTHPLAVLLLLAAVLSVVAGTPSLAWAILAVVVLNAVFSFMQEHQDGSAVEALGCFVPPQAQVRRRCPASVRSRIRRSILRIIGKAPNSVRGACGTVSS